MFNDKVSKGLQVSFLALAVLKSLAGAASAEGEGSLGEAATQLAAQGDHFQATAASIDVVPAKMAGGCPQSFAFNVRLGAQSPGTLTYRFVTEDGRESQVFEAETAKTQEGPYIARAGHLLILSEDEEAGPGQVILSVPPR